jgi:3-hydroxyacyl-[acyl-carrier-protein] dehydratase
VLADRTNIRDLIPQREPVVMVHNLAEATDEHAVSTFMIESSNIFVANGLFTEAGLIENMAQTAAAQAGYMYRQKNMPVPIGFIAAIKDLTINKLPQVDSSIKTTINVTNKVFEVTLIKGIVEQHGEELCSCEMRIFTKS